MMCIGKLLPLRQLRTTHQGWDVCVCVWSKLQRRAAQSQLGVLHLHLHLHLAICIWIYEENARAEDTWAHMHQMRSRCCQCRSQPRNLS